MNFFRKDLNLKNRWWHRLLLVIFACSFFCAIGVNMIYKIDDAQFPKYKKVELLSDRMDSESRRLFDIVKPEEKIAVYEYNLYGSYNGEKFYDGNGGWLLKQPNIYCSKNIPDHIEKISEKTNINHYKGNLNLISLRDFKNYLIQVDAHCVNVLNLTSVEHFGDVEKAIVWELEVENMNVWEESLIKSIFSVLQNIFFISFGFFILLVFYYKILLYIIFGHKKDN